MIAKIYSSIPQGYNGHLVTVEGDSNRGLPAFNIVGMANKTIYESRERVRATLVNSGFTFPARKVTINLAPAELAKDGTHLDLPIALAILVLSQQLLPEDVSGCLFVGELSLDGLTKPVRGIINVVEAAKQAGFHTIFLPAANLQSAKLISDIKIIGVHNLLELFLHLKHTKFIQPDSTPVKTLNNKNIERTHKNTVQHNVVKNTQTDTNLLWDSICGHPLAKRALAIAIAGHHNILLTGPPGSGKTMLAKAATSLQPPLSAAEKIAVTKIHALHSDIFTPISKRPFRSPHHSASSASIIGGGARAQPGEISLAHHGILFLDEFPEYPRNVIEALRGPLEDHEITISRANQRFTYPANFMLIATMNPCPCGYLGDPHHQCTCTAAEISRYQKRLSGPILDRIDLVIPVSPVDQSLFLTSSQSTTIVKNTKTDSNYHQNPIPKNVVKNTRTDKKSSDPLQAATLKPFIAAAIKRQSKRYQNPSRFNSDLSSAEVLKYVKLDPAAENLLQTASRKLDLSTRAYFKILKVAQSISDLSGLPSVGVEQISEALSYRFRISPP